MDSLDVMDMAKLLAALVTVEAMRGANEEARTGGQSTYQAKDFDKIRLAAASVLDHMEWWHNKD
jgi:hypothetical protein